MRALPLCLLVLVACDSRPNIQWRETTERRATRTGPSEIVPPAEALRCVGIARFAKGQRGDWYAVWWAVQRDSTGFLVVARSADGKSWSDPVTVDTTDAAPVGCRRPAPSIAADADNVHVAYAMKAREGAGIFVSHSMDGGKLFHAPVAVVYGDNERGSTGKTDIAAEGNLVVIAYEDPNSSPTRIGVAVSRTMAHLFDWRGLVSDDIGAAADPRVSLFQGRAIVSWVPRGGGSRVARMADIGGTK